jgi:phosphoribosylglycinamide formyltransferase-1
VSNKKEAYILDRARAYHLPSFFIDTKDVSREEYDRQVSTLLKEKKTDLIILIGYMRILSSEFVTTWEHKIINVHPSLLPAFAGKMDADVHRAVLESGVSETGCTVHYVTAEVDAGPILLQKKCPVYRDDTVDELKARVQELEKLALVEAVNLVYLLSLPSPP